MFVLVCTCQQNPEESVEVLEVGITSSFEPPDLCGGNQTPVSERIAINL